MEFWISQPLPIRSDLKDCMPTGIEGPQHIVGAEHQSLNKVRGIRCVQHCFLSAISTKLKNTTITGMVIVGIIE